MLMIRLARIGKNKKPSYRFVVSEKAKDTKGTYLEIVGWYNPITQPATIEVKADRIKYWISKGAQLSASVNNLLVDQKVVKNAKVKVSSPKKSKADKKKAA